MLDIQYLRLNQKAVEKACRDKGFDPEIVLRVLKLDEQRRQLTTKIQEIRFRRNKLNLELKKGRDQNLIDTATKLKKELLSLEPELKHLEIEFESAMLKLPNIPAPEVPVGPDDSGNVLVKEWGEKPKFQFDPKDHIRLGVDLDILDFDRGAKIAGFRGYFLKNQAVMMHYGVMRYALDRLVAKGFIPMLPPIVDRKEAFINSGHFPWGEAEAYALADEGDEEKQMDGTLGGVYKQAKLDFRSDTYLAGTAEVPLVSYHAGEILNEKDLPLLYAGFSPCFRREIGSYGKDTRGMYRVHEFMKIEQVVLCASDWQESVKWHEQLAEYAQEMLRELGLPYRVMLMCTGDMGEPQMKKYDIDTWMPGRNAYGETMSDSIMGDFQSRRANIRYRASDGTLKYVHMLNNTALASPRILIALWENYQQADGSIVIPKVLIPYVGFEVIKR